MFDSVDPKQSLPDLEEGILQYWREEDIFKRSMQLRSRGRGDKLDGAVGDREETFSFYDGPPFATGLPHYGHLLAGTIKDVIPRYQTMRGKHVERRFGWDCHGLPIENLIEQEHGIGNKQEIEEKGVGWFNDLCRSSVQRYTSDWRSVVERMGRWVDMDWDYRTMDPEYMESMWWAFSELHKKELIYEGHKPMHICPRCVTPLSNFEVTQGYADITDQSVTAKFELADEPGTFVLAWTTTPWTLPGNLLLAVQKDITYAKVKEEDTFFLLAEDLVESVFDKREHEVVETMKGKKLIGKKYTPLFPYFVEEYGETAFKIVEGDFVTTDDGTGIVHIAPGFGEDDFQIGEKEGLPLLQHISMEGAFVDKVTDFAGMNVKPKDDPTKTDQKVIELLEKQGKAFSKQKYKHSYPHCWRCDSPLLNYATSSWFVKVEKIKEKMLSNNAKTEWVPSHIRDGRYGNWLEGARDWAISRNRYWGTPLPIWRSAETGDLDVIGSRDDLMREKKIRFTKITAVRHGESEGNLIPIYQGEEPGTDLTDAGKSQAKNTAKHFANEQIQTIYCSPLARTKQTAEVLAKELGAEIIVDERLREVSFGEYEGKTVDFSDLSFIKARRAHKLESGKPESIYHFEGMETWDSVTGRIESFMEEILPRHRSEHILVVTHADPVQNIRAFFTKEDAVKLSHQPYPSYVHPYAFFWDHERQEQMDLHKDNVDDISWPGSESDKSIELTMVRHGETDWNKERKLQGGECDIPLNDTGKTQVRELAKKLQGQTFDYIVSSDLQRTKETAKILSEELGVPMEEPIAQLRERNIGNWGGKTLVEVQEMQPAPLETKNGVIRNCTPEGGESFGEYLARVEEATEILLERYAGKKILLAGHRGLMQFMKIVSQNLTYKEALAYVPENGSFETFMIDQRLKRIPEVLDCWFESGSMPYAQKHYPFELGDKDRKNPPGFPADFIAEGLDQTRAWFYTLMVLSTALFDETPFKNVVVNGIVLAEDGKKMSKRLKNYPDPMEVVSRHGADAVRFALMSSPAVRAEDLRFSEKFVEETVRSVLLPLWNTYSFFVTYANAANFEAMETRRHSTHPLDTWIRAEAQDLVNRMTTELDNYDLSATCAEIHETIDALTNWYVRLSRRRFAGKGAIDVPDASGDQEDEERSDALATLHDVLLTISQLLAPFCPYITDAIYLNLIEEEHHSIHMTDWPEARNLTKEEEHTIGKNRLMRLIVSLGLSVRADQKVKIRQPLTKATIALPPSMQESVRLAEEDLGLLRQELNVKEIAFAQDPESLAESYVQVDARKVGPRFGQRVQEIIKAGKEGEFRVEKNGNILILDETLTSEEATVVYRGREGENVAADRGVVVSMDTEITKELELEGEARDLIRAIQRLRKETGLSFTDNIALHIEGADDILAIFAELIAQETRSTMQDVQGDDHPTELTSRKVTIRFSKLN
jgi:isoleucyl-tRNA synthetase/bisphosphoglycerate-dependent phosphoglycerate mutase